MKYIWEEEDIIHGRWAARDVNGTDEVVCIVWAYDSNIKRNRTGLCAISTDGLVYYPQSIANTLTTHKYRPIEKPI